MLLKIKQNGKYLLSSLRSHKARNSLHLTCGNARDSLNLIHVRSMYESHTYQCSLSVWRKAESPSINSRMATVSTAHGANTMKMATAPTGPSIFSPVANTMDHSTSDNSTVQETIFGTPSNH